MDNRDTNKQLIESKDPSEKFEEAIPLHKALKDLYESLTKALVNDPPPEVRTNLWDSARKALLLWIIQKIKQYIIFTVIAKNKN